MHAPPYICDMEEIYDPTQPLEYMLIVPNIRTNDVDLCVCISKYLINY